MSLELLLRYFHFVRIFAIVGGLVSEHLSLKPRLSKKELNRLAKIDGIFHSLRNRIDSMVGWIWKTAWILLRKPDFSFEFYPVHWNWAIDSLPNRFLSEKPKRKSGRNRRLPKSSFSADPTGNAAANSDSDFAWNDGQRNRFIKGVFSDLNQIFR